MEKITHTYLITFVYLLFLTCVVLFWGDIPFSVVWKDACNQLLSLTRSSWNPLLDERLPRLIILLCTGASLAVSGAVMQSLFQNPLASPSVLGISCGSSLCVIIVLLLQWHLYYPFAIPFAAFIGAMTTLTVVYLLSRFEGLVDMNMLILTGIALSTLLLAIQGVIMYAIRENWQLIQTITEWESGSTINKNWQHVHMQLPLTIFGLWSCWHYRREMDILTLGTEEAINLGVEVHHIRTRLFFSVSLLTAGAIAAVGIIAFFGLILPHIIRKLYGPSNMHLIPLCICFGSVTLTSMDVFLRIFAFHALSIGNITTIVGGIFFIFLLWERRKHYTKQLQPYF